MDDGSRCLADVINDPQLLQSFLENDNNGANGLTDNQQAQAKAAIVSRINQSAEGFNTNGNNRLTFSIIDTKQVDHVTSTGENSYPTLRQTSVGGFVFDEKQALNIVSSSVGLISLSGIPTSAATSITLAQPTSVTFPSVSTALRTPSPSISWPQSSIQIATPRNTGPVSMQIPQHMLVPTGAVPIAHSGGGLSRIVLTSPPMTGATHAQLPPGIQPGQLVQIIHTPNGPQILPANAAVNAPLQHVVTSCNNGSSKSLSTPTASRSNKQILPKPPGTVSNTNNNVQNNGNKCNSVPQGNAIKVMNSLVSSATPFPTTTLSTSAAATAPQQQIIINPGGQPSGVIAAGPQGTFLLNHLIPGLGPAPILIQGNIGNVPGSVQLTLRPQPNVTVNSTNITSSEQNSALLSALSNGPQTVAAKPQVSAPSSQPIVIPNHTSVVSTAPTQGMVYPTAQPGMMMTTGPRGTPNFIFTRPPQFAPSPAQQPAGQQFTSGQQFLQIQTPNGPVLVALQTHYQNQGPQMHVTSQANVQNQNGQNIQIGNTVIPMSAASTLPNVSTNLQSHTHPALHALLNQHPDNTNGQTILQTVNPVSTSNTVILTSQNQIFTGQRSQQQTSPSFVVTGQTQTKNTAPSVNLAELLKEHGILPEMPESSPPSSPSNEMTSLNMNSDGIHQNITQQQTVVMVPNQTPNIVLTQAPVAPNAAPQLRLALTPDGSVILHPHHIGSAVLQQPLQFQTNSSGKTLSETIKDNSGLGSSQPSPDSTTPTIDSTSTTTSTTTVTTTSTVATVQTAQTQSQNTSALIEQLNTAPAVNVPDLVTLQQVSNDTNHVEEQKVSQKNLIPLTVQSINNTHNNVNMEQQRHTILTIPVSNGESATNNGQSNAAVIRIGNCDTLPTSLVLTHTSNPVQFTSPTKTQGSTGVTVTIAPSSVANCISGVNANSTGQYAMDQNGVPVIQVSPNNHEFIQKLETQLKSLLALKSPTQHQKNILQELLGLQQKMIQAQVQSSGSEEQKVMLNSSAPNTVQIQLAPQQKMQQQQQQQQQQQKQNLHLVNLLNQTPVNQTSQQIRLLTSTNTTPVNGTIQLGNQIITFTTPAKQQLQNLKTIGNNNNQGLAHQTILRPHLTTSASTVILRLQTPTFTTSAPSPVSSKHTPKQIDSHTEQEKKNIRTLKNIQQQLSIDQSAALKPDIKTPFLSRDDACKRLLRYHVFNTPSMSVAELEKSDELFETVARHLLYRKQQLDDKLRILLLKQSMKETASSEHVMIDRMFISEETSSLKSDKESVAEGKVLDLPPPPESWYQMMRATMEEEEQKLNINRKRKSSIAIEDEFCAPSSQRRHEEPEDESDESEDEDEDSDDEDDDNDKDPLTNFLEDNISDVNTYYSNVDYDHQSHLHLSRLNGHVPLNNYVESGATTSDYGMYPDMSQDNSQEWANCAPSLMPNTDTRRMQWNDRFGESEAAVAVESILNAEDEGEAIISVDGLSGIDALDDDNDEEDEDDEEGDDDDDDDEDDEEENDYMASDENHHQQHSDAQMQCAIKSILDIPVQQPPPSHSASYLNSDHNHSHLNEYRSFYLQSQRYQRHHISSGMLPDCVVNRHAACVNDPILDEAVKSILS